MQPDSPLERIRKARCQISEECGHDPKRLVEYYMKLQEEKYADRLVKPSKRTATSDAIPDTSSP